jgi:hypothetical protein
VETGFRSKDRKIYFLDETWLNEGHATSKVWVDSAVKSRKQAFLSGLSSILKELTGKGRRLLTAYIGSDSGFVDGSLLVFKTKSMQEYHKEMTREVFLTWIQYILPKLEPNSVIVMDNASHDSVKPEQVPIISW